MRESDSEGVATHVGPAPCADVRKDGGEASAGVHAGRVLSCENYAPRRKPRTLRGADAVDPCGRQNQAGRQREACLDLAQSETPRTRGINSHGNREIPSLAAARGAAARTVKPQGERR